MTYVTEEQATGYVSYQQFQEMYDRILLLEDTLSEKLTGGEETPENSTPEFGDIAIISANYDGSFFVRWYCKDPRGRELKYYISVNEQNYFFTETWNNGSYYTCYIPPGHTEVGENTCNVIASNDIYETLPKAFTVTIPKKHVPTAPTISQDIPDVSDKVAAVISLKYTASDDVMIVSHKFYNGVKLVDITDRVSQVGTEYEYLTTWTTPISIPEVYFEVTDNEELTATSNKFKVVIT